MKFLSAGLLTVFAIVSSGNSQEWVPLFDKELSKWEVWTGAPHTSVDIKWADKCTNPNDGKPMGKGDPLKVFTMTQLDDGSEALRVSGQVLSALTTKEKYSSYRLRTEVKWGTKRFPPKQGGARDSGIIFHCHGPDGIFWNAYKQGLEFQVQEGEIGYYYRIGSVTVKASLENVIPGKKSTYSPLGIWHEVGTQGSFSFRGHEAVEDRKGWTQIEIIVDKDRAIYLVGGEVVGAFQEAKGKMGKQMALITEGQIQIQSAGAEVFYRNMEMQKITGIPEKYRALFAN